MGLPSDNSLVFRTTQMLKWGVGKGSPLTKDEVDNNFWQLLEYISQVAASGIEGVGIATVTVAHGQISFVLTNGLTWGPFDLPSQAFNWTGAFVGGAVYHRFDVLTSNDGAYLVLQDHTAGSTFDPAATNLSGALYGLMFPYQNLYDLSFYYPGRPGFGIDVGDALFALQSARDFYLPIDLTGSVAGFKVNPVDGIWIADINKNGVTVGTYTFDPTASVPHGFFTFTAAVQFHLDDLLEVIPPAAIDSAAKGFRMTVMAHKGTF